VGKATTKATAKTKADPLPTPASKLAGDPGFGDDNKKSNGKTKARAKTKAKARAKALARLNARYRHPVFLRKPRVGHPTGMTTRKATAEKATAEATATA
jgi:hypothetical protein